MPRLPPSILRRAHAIDRFLPPLLGPCRNLRAAQNELRWLREHVDKVAKARHAKGDTISKGSLLGDLVRQRARGKPLQYILGTEYFGDLEIRCRPGVLIPRQDTAASITHLVHLIHAAPDLPSELRLLDLCTGTGCIPLLFRHELFASRPSISLRALGVDVSYTALKLASHNFQRMRKLHPASFNDPKAIEFIKADVLINPFSDYDGGSSIKAALNYHRASFWDILVSNPPYVSSEAYRMTTERSVRLFEPKLALVPPNMDGDGNIAVEREDTFYKPLLTIARDVEAKIVLLEVSDVHQALRVARVARALGIFDGVEIWRDQPGVSEETPSSPIDDIPIIGAGNARSVLCWRGKGAQWLGKHAVSLTPPTPAYHAER
ncbi:S-adenosyl-L-methionine-dependent methyltransferase [Massarina eburnea CBS 473.64]|uniref:S-adenosyl-L-methionine-dependent methyltransferase n=1 Tax=Massarina eburnea CBS 473.64 TaxID=1395130 RepID=A0A6A6RYW0_9PLEO|nr:S-adenosyl-L-methionine-dependent methyltransferase [Massarina eburnea CBS 473.64]